MPNQKNQTEVQVLAEKIAKAKSIAIVDYQGTTVVDQVELRSALKEVGGELYVTKNTLFDIAAGKGKFTESLNGMTAIIFSYEDPVAAIKKLFGFQKTKDKLTIKQGMFEGNVISSQELEALSKLPSKEELISTLISRLQGPAYGLVNVLQASTRNLVYALKAISEKSA